MSGLSLPVSRPTGRALLVAGVGNRARALDILRRLGFGATELEDPYAAMAELCRRPLVYRALILSLTSLYREELSIIPAVKARFPHVEVWLAQTDGRQAALAEGMRLGADGLLAEDGLHRVAHPMVPGATEPGAAEEAPRGVGSEPLEDALHDDATSAAGPVLTADELRALLHEQSPVPPDEE